MVFRQEINDQEFITRLYQYQPFSVISYLIWYHYCNRDKIEYRFSLKPFTYIYRYDNKYNFFGKDFWQLGTEIRWFRENIVLIFQEESLWSRIEPKFENFRSLETNKPIESFETYITYTLSQKSFVFQEDELHSIIQLPSNKYSVPKRYRPLNSDLNFGLIKNQKIVSFAAAPHIMTNHEPSFAILRGIETTKLERELGYAQAVLSKLCEELFLKYEIKKIILWVEEANKPARNLYKKIGFQEDAKVSCTYCDRKRM